MTKANGNATKIRTPEESGEYRIFVTDSTGKILSKSEHLLRLSGSASTVDAASAEIQQGVQTENCSEGGMDIAYIENNDYIGFKGVDFGTGAESIDLRVAATNGGSSIEIRIDAPNGELIGTCEVPSTGGWQDWATQNAKLAKTTGVHDMYMVFKGGEGYLFNLAWYKLNGGQADILYGDLDYNGTINGIDLTLLKQLALSGDYTKAADLNGDNCVDAEDAQLHRDYLLGTVDSFPVG